MKNVLKRSCLSNLANNLDVSISTMSVDDMTNTLDMIDKESKENTASAPKMKPTKSHLNDASTKKLEYSHDGDFFGEAMERFESITNNIQSLTAVLCLMLDGFFCFLIFLTYCICCCC